MYQKLAKLFNCLSAKNLKTTKYATSQYEGKKQNYFKKNFFQQIIFCFSGKINVIWGCYCFHIISFPCKALQQKIQIILAALLSTTLINCERKKKSANLKVKLKEKKRSKQKEKRFKVLQMNECIKNIEKNIQTKWQTNDHELQTTTVSSLSLNAKIKEKLTKKKTINIDGETILYKSKKENIKSRFIIQHTSRTI